MNQLPLAVQETIAEGLSKVKMADLEKAFASLSHAYRSEKKSGKHLIASEVERFLYLVARLPATYAVICKVLETMPRVEKGRLLDIGAGPGTFLLAANAIGHSFAEATLIEKDRGWQAWGEKLHHGNVVKWRFDEIEKSAGMESYDVVSMSYSFGEFDPKERQKILEKCWEWTSRYLVIVEPGTPAGFQRIREARESLLRKGAFILAPCPHANTCPMAGSDWCHFSTRLPRTSLHRRVKGGDLGYEDEKFSYVILSKEQHALPSARILRHPERNKGHVRLHLCTQNNLEQKVFSKKLGELYKKACRLEWGDFL